ncbi:MAG: hypothetical protein AB1489_28015, partial [Acidobacteriota bacterium]
GNGTGSLRIAPALSDTQGGRVTVRVTDPLGLSAETSFNVTVQKTVRITDVTFSKPNLFISGIGFGTSGVVVRINDVDVSSRIVGSPSDNAITLKGSKKKLNIKSGPNTFVVISGGVSSAPFIRNF